MMITTKAKCQECDRVFDLLDEVDADEWLCGHDCEPFPGFDEAEAAAEMAAEMAWLRHAERATPDDEAFDAWEEARGVRDIDPQW